MSVSFDGFSEISDPHIGYLSTQRKTQDLRNTFGIKGYKIPKKTQMYITKQHRFPKDKNRAVFGQAQKRAKEPSPFSYSPDSHQIAKQYWERPEGKFRKGKRSTQIEEIMKLQRKTPGPGSYNQTEKGKLQPLPKLSLGVIFKTQGVNFLSDREFLAQSCPGVGQYFKKEQERNKSYALREKKAPFFKYTPIKPEKPIPKQTVGPGYIKNLDAAYSNQALTKRTPKFTFKKAPSGGTLQEIMKMAKQIPGAGHYRDLEKAYSSNLVKKRSRTPTITKAKMIRISQQEAKKKSWVPGPGAYEILPPIRNG